MAMTFPSSTMSKKLMQGEQSALNEAAEIKQNSLLQTVTSYKQGLVDSVQSSARPLTCEALPQNA